MLLPRMINDAFKLTIDKIHFYQKPESSYGRARGQGGPSVNIMKNQSDLLTYPQPYPVPGYGDNSNMWQKLCTLSNSNIHPKI